MCVYGRVLRIRWAKVRLFIEIAITFYTLFFAKSQIFYIFAPKQPPTPPFREIFAPRLENFCAPVRKRFFRGFPDCSQRVPKGFNLRIFVKRKSRRDKEAESTR